ncbi:MAG: hypothetical protein GX180_09010, partial [Enterococcus sp.]|nr:hypothetical protein [Enterococcus sp.]
VMVICKGRNPVEFRQTQAPTSNGYVKWWVVDGTWTYHWWGYDQYFDNQRAQRFSANCYSVAAGATLVTGIGAWFPPVSFVGVAQAAYWTLVGSRVDYNNLGNGVYIGVTWAAIFNVEPL